MKILVTGAAGFIGSHLVDAYLQQGHEVIGIDDLSAGRLQNLEHISSSKFRFEKLSLLDEDFVEFVSHLKPDLINHHAAQKSVRDSMSNPENDAHINVLGTIRTLEAARKAHCRKFIFASTGGVLFDENKTERKDALPFAETAAFYPSSPYGLSKIAGESYVRFYARTYGVEAVIFRYANVYGPRQDPLGEAGVLAIFCEQILKNAPIKIFGDGKQTRDFVFVNDVVNLNKIAVEKINGVQVFHVGTGVETDILKLIQILEGFAQAKVKIDFEPGRPGEARRSCLNSTLVQETWGFSPRTTIESGLESTWNWFKDR